MDEKEKVNKNYEVLFINHDRRMVLYNPHTNALKLSESQMHESESISLWSSPLYFKILEDYYIRNSNYNNNALPPPLSEYLMNGYFDRFFPRRNKIASGGGGSVYRVHHQLAGYDLAEYAVKIIPFGEYTRLGAVLNEVRIYQRLSFFNQPFILRYYHCWIENFQPAIIGPKIPCLFILMEFSPYGNLEDFLSTHKYLRESNKWKIFLQIASALQHLHNNNIIHRDLKMANILVFDSDVDNSFKFKFVMSDFGTSQFFQNYSTPSFQRTGATGTIETMAPELLEQSSNGKFVNTHSFKSDIWSLGVIMFAIFTGVNPFSRSDGEILLKSYTNVEDLMSNIGINPNILPNSVLKLIGSMMNKKSSARPTIDEVITNEDVGRHIKDLQYEFYFKFVPHKFQKQSSNLQRFKFNSTKYPTEQEIRLSIPLSIDYQTTKKMSQNKDYRWKFQILLLIALACIQHNSIIISIFHWILCICILKLSVKRHCLIYIIPALGFIEILYFPNNTIFIIVLITLIILFLTKKL